MRALTYADAVALLGGNSPAVATLDRALGGLLLGATGGGAAMLASLLGARGEVVRVGHELVGGIRDRVRGYSRFDRTQRLLAAHTVVVITSFFEALSEATIPFDLDSVELTAEDQLRLAGRQDREQSMVRALLVAEAPVPGPHMPFEKVLADLKPWYRRMAHEWLTFVSGLAIWDELSEAQQRLVGRVLADSVPDRALGQYEIHYRQLALDAPEFAWWSGQQEHQATRRSMAALESRLRELVTGDEMNERRRLLSRGYRAALARPILSDGEAPNGLAIPTLEASYIDPDFRLVRSSAGRSASSESLWESVPVDTDIATFLAGYLTAAAATEAPLLILGQPGAGKSVLTRILAARLPPDQFLPARVELRDVPADADVQDQIEHALRAVTGYALSWPQWSSGAGHALPVVLLDGFDELLQATGVSHTDYLLRVARFQQREADQGRPVAVIVTSRTAVADRARTPAGTVLMRLEPFRPEQTEQWLLVWNSANRDRLATRGLDPLDPATVLRLPDLASQPLLLLMLALYDADNNELHRQTGDLDKVGLYEQLLRAFAYREVRKGAADRSDAVVDAAVDSEMLRLSVVAFATFNRGRLWVTEAELDADLAVLHGRLPRQRGLRADLGDAETALGRFFFVQRARATRDGQEWTTYEFLHATFGEYLIARLVHRLVEELAAQEQAAAGSIFGAGGCRDGLFHALLSFAPLATRSAVLVDFLKSMTATTPTHARRSMSQLAVTLFHRLDSRPDDTRYTAYQPASWPMPGRYARYGLNLVLLAATYCDSAVTGSALFPNSDDVVADWRTHVRLWQSTLADEEWAAVLGVIVVEHRWESGARDLDLRIAWDGQPARHLVDLGWTYDIPAVPRRGWSGWRFVTSDVLSRHVAVTADAFGAMAVHTLEPFLQDLGDFVTTFALSSAWDRSATPDPRPHTILHELLRLAAARASGRPPENAKRIYNDLFQVLTDWANVFPAEAQGQAITMALHHLVSDSPHLDTEGLTSLAKKLADMSPTDLHRELMIEAVIEHVAVVKPTSDAWSTLRAAAEQFVTTPTDPTYVSWNIGLWEAGVRPVEPMAVADVDWTAIQRRNPRLVTRARAMYRTEFDTDLDITINHRQSL